MKSNIDKVGIVTLWYKDCNFGSTIQNWALHLFLKEKFNINACTIVNKNTSGLGEERKEFLQFSNKAWNAFDQFKQTIPHEIIFPEDIGTDTASFFIIGGDQVINAYDIPPFDLRYNMLCNLPKNTKILYSAGIDFDQFSTKLDHPKVKACYDQLKTNVQDLSFREKLRSFPSAAWHIDPALLIPKEDYEKIEEKPEGEIPKKFDFLYVVKHSDREFTNILTFFLKNRKSKYALITNRDDLNLGPKQILWCIHHCKTLYTNSFHGFVFSIIFNKKVKIYYPADFRYQNIFELLNLKYKNEKLKNYKEVKKNIQEQQQKAFEYFNKNFQEYLPPEKYPQIFAAFRKSSRDLSTSGGISAALAEAVFELKGVVYGAAYARDFCSVHHVRVTNMDEYYAHVASSKYNISFTKECFPKIVEELEKGIFVMFTGMPCQIRSLKKYLKKDYPNLLTVDLFCHGVSKQSILEKYVTKIENDHKSKIIKLNMRTNHTTILTAYMENGEVFKDEKATHGLFLDKSNIHRMCQSCVSHYGNNVSDITLGDFWDIEKYFSNDPLFNKENVWYHGINYVKISTSKGAMFFDLIKDKIRFASAKLIS